MWPLRRPPSLVAILASALLLAHEGTRAAAPPPPLAVNFATFGSRDQDHEVVLRNLHVIPDADEISLEIEVPNDHGNISGVELTVHRIFHEDTGDLSISLVHDEKKVDLVSAHCKGCKGKALGEPRNAELMEQTYYPEADAKEVRGDGYSYSFSDLLGTNIAEGKNATQSSTGYGCSADRAVDGNVDGRLSRGSVTHTAGHGSTSSLSGVSQLVEPNPWWQVDLGSTTSIGTIKVWNQEEEMNVDEVQTVTVASAANVSGSFRLSFTRSYSDGRVPATVTATTSDISVDAVAMISDEVPGSTLAGQGPGESMQAKLQSLSTIGNTVVVERSQGRLNSYVWTVYFVGIPGDVEQLQYDATGSSLAPASALASVQVATLIQGNANPFYNYKQPTGIHTQRLFPAWVMVLNEDLNSTGTLEHALSRAVHKELIEIDRRETTVSFPSAVTGRYVRIQLTGKRFLSIAEVQVFAELSKSLYHFRGGSPIAAGSYHSEETMFERFRNISTGARGMWVLQIRDYQAATYIRKDGQASFPKHRINGRGGIDHWDLTIIDAHGQKHRYVYNLVMRIETLPKFGSLYFYNATSKGKGKLITPVLGSERFTSLCYDNCRSKFGTSEGLPNGVGNALSTSPHGSLASGEQNHISHQHKVVYVPNSAFVGEDDFEYTVYSGSVRSANVGKVGVHTSVCRVSDCEYARLEYEGTS